MTHFLGAEVTKELENLTADVNTNVNLEAQQNQENNSQGNEEFVNPNENTSDEINDEEMKDYEGPEWVNVTRIRRYKATIAAENVEGDTFAKKVTNVNKKISHIEDFMGSRVTYIQNKAQVYAVYEKKKVY